MKISRIDLIGLNGNGGEHYEHMDGERWLETGSPWPERDEVKLRAEFEESANFDPVPEQ